MQYYQLVTASMAAAFFLVVFTLIRKDAILVGAALRWFILAVVILLLGIFPEISDIIAGYLGIAYPPILPVIIACVLLMAKALLADINHATNQVKIDRVSQKLAIVEQQLRELTESKRKNGDS